MNKNIYEKTRYPGIKRNKKNKNYIIDICKNGIRTSISTIDGTRKGQKIYDIDTARKIQQNPDILKRISLSINNKETVNEVFEIYMYDAEYNKNLAKRTLNKKRSNHNNYVKDKIGKKKLFEVTEDDILDIKITIDKKCNTSSSKYSVLKDIKAFFNWLVDKNILDKSPCKGIMQFKKDKIVHTIWSHIDVENFRLETEKDFNNSNWLVAYKARLIHLLVNLDYSMSSRIGETRALQLKKILFQSNEISISATIGTNGEIIEQTKTDVSVDKVDVPCKIMNEIKEYIKWCEDVLDIDFREDTPLFLNPFTLKPYSSTAIRNIFKMYSRRANLKEMPIYNLRHSGVALMQELNTEMYFIQNRVRHKNIETTIDTYGSISKKSKRKFVDNLENYF